MPSDIDDNLAELENVRNLIRNAPYPALHCPTCDQHDSDGFQLLYTIHASCPITWDGPRKVIGARRDEELQADDVDGSYKIECLHCSAVFQLPDEWNIVFVQPAQSKKPSPEWECIRCNRIVSGVPVGNGLCDFCDTIIQNRKTRVQKKYVP